MRRVSTEYEAALDRLYAAPPEGFIEIRKQLAGELKESGDDEGSVKIKEAKKPTVAAWALNQISRRNPDQLESLFQASESLGGAKGKAAREASEARHRAVSALVDAAASYLEEAGRPATESVKEKITETLYAVSTDEEARTLLERGWLAKEVKPGALGGFEVLTLEGDEKEEDDNEAARKEKEEKVGKLRRQAKELSERADQLRADASKLIEAADHLTVQATDLKKEADAVDLEIA